VPVLTGEHLLRGGGEVLVDASVPVVVLAVEELLVHQPVAVIVRLGGEPGAVSSRDSLVRRIDGVDRIERGKELELVSSGGDISGVVARDRADPHRPDVEVLTAAPSRRDSVQGELTVSHPSDVGYEELEQSDVVIEDVGLGD